MNRKKNISGQASDENMKTHGQGLDQEAKGEAPEMEGRREQAAGQDQPQRGVNPTAPMQRPKTQAGQMSGHMNTQGQGLGGGAQQQRPSASQGANPFAARPVQSQQNQQAQRPQQFQQTSSGQQSTRASGSKGFSPLLIIVVLAVVLLGGGGGLSGLFGGGTDSVDLPTGGNTSGSNQSGSSLIESLLSGGQGSDDTYYQATAAPTRRPTATPRPTAAPTAAPTQANSADALLSALLGGSTETAAPTAAPTKVPATSDSNSALIQQLLGGSWYGQQTGYGTSSYAGQAASAVSNTASAVVDTSVRNGVMDTSVASGSRAKYTQLLGKGRDTVTIMIYMCGADLESRSAMGTKDLQEMLNASYGDNVRVIVFTGGSTKWQNNLVSSSCNQIWQVAGGKMIPLNQNAGNAAMTSPDNLASFIQYCAKNFPASRYGLILWDHGSGSVSGYGYDEKNSRSGSMSLAGLNSAFKAGNVKFDFIGFDACLMATVETALMASNYADYLIASEETEPGIGWYYTNWLTKLGKNTSLSTLEIGKQICDDFVEQCNRQCRGQNTTLSVTDLAELSNTVPAQLKAFSQSVSSMISNQEYKTVSNARNGSREFAASSRIDQVDLTDLCFKLNTQESMNLAAALRGAVKYNRINNISNAHGLSVYFPYQKVSNVDKAVSTYAAIGLDSSYSQAIRDFASVEASGQAVSGGYGSAAPSLFGSSGYDDSYGSSDMIGELLSAFLGGGFGRMADLNSDNTAFLSDRALGDEALGSYLTANYLDASQLAFQKSGENWVLNLTPEQWSLVHGADLNIFYDNGEGYVDLGLDNLFSFDENGAMVADLSGTWLAIDGQPVPYYHETSEQFSDTDWRISGRVPVLLNGVRADLLVVFDQDHEGGYVAGARTVYENGETETVAKTMDGIAVGDVIEFVAALYDYNQNYQNSYRFGKAVTVGENGLTVSDVYLPDASKIMATYRFTDIYNQAYWTPVIGK